MARRLPSIEAALRRALPLRGRVLLGVSGGIDSMVLLAGALRVAPAIDLTIHVAHLDHGLRPSSGADADFVDAAARRAGLPCHRKTLMPPENGVNIEAWGRLERYRFFDEVCRAHDLDLVATAHTATDVAETLLMRLVSNKEPGTIAPLDPTRGVVRPLITIPRAAIERYARQNAIEWREDPSNRSLDFLRNRIRHTLVPVLTEFDPRIDETLAERAAAIALDAELLDDVARCAFAKPPEPWGGREWLSSLRHALAAAPAALRWRIVDLAFYPTLGFRLGRRHGARAAVFLAGNGRVLELPNGISVTRRGGGLTIDRVSGT